MTHVANLLFKTWTPGTKITEPGAYLNVDMTAYHGDICDGPSVSSSGLRRIFNESPRHFWDNCYLNPNREERPATEAMILGRAAHHIFLGEADFYKHFVRQPDRYPDSKTGAPKAWSNNADYCREWNGKQALAGLTVINDKMLEQIRGMGQALAEEPIVRGGILNGHVECSLFWKDDETGIWIKSRPDNIPVAGAEASDLKCVSSVADDALSRGLADHGYHAQGACVREAFDKVWGIKLEHFTLVYVEQKRPHCVDFREPDELDQGYEENHAALRLMKRGLETGHWPGPKGQYGDGSPLSRPKYAADRAAARLAAINAEFAGAR